jgi:serine/threonine-protein kinase
VSDLTGEIIDGRYKLNRIVASGGMATIYAATDLRLDRTIAVKIMHPHLAQDEKFVERFIREAKAAASLSHPNIVAVLDQGWNQGGTPCVFIVMELIEGSTLRDYLFEQGPASVEQTLQMLMPVASALAAAHKMGIVHRDIKPENILVSKEGRIKIADFGLARGALLGTTLTAESSVILGSVSYLSPEQVQRGVADSRSDIYSLGIVLFELLTGTKPYQGEDPVQIAIRHVNDRVPAPSSINPAIPKEIDELVLSATDVNPDKRPKDGAEFFDQLRALSESRTRLTSYAYKATNSRERIKEEVKVLQTRK